MANKTFCEISRLEAEIGIADVISDYALRLKLKKLRQKLNGFVVKESAYSPYQHPEMGKDGNELISFYVIASDIRLTVRLEAGFLENSLFGLFDNGTLKAGVIDQRATTRWIAILQEIE